jgi:hypothetical protein
MRDRLALLVSTAALFPGGRRETVPDIPRDAIIVAAAAPNLEQASPTYHGWMISDMYAFNYLLKKGFSEGYLIVPRGEEIDQQQ